MKSRCQLNDKLRLKVTDKCNMQCSFCHSEGSCGVNDIVLGSETDYIFKELRNAFSKVHLTGGEPTLYNHLEQLVELLYSYEYKISMTTNGYFKPDKLAGCLDKLSSINFSLHSLNDEFLKNTVENTADYKERVISNILELKNRSKISINTVVTNSENQNIDEIIEFCINNNIKLNILNELSNRILPAVRAKVLEYGFTEKEKIFIYPSSNVRTLFRDASGNTLIFKEIEYFTPQFWCHGCSMLNRCDEGFSFIRLEGNPIKVRICINKEAISYEMFMKYYYHQIKELYEAFYEDEYLREWMQKRV